MPPLLTSKHTAPYNVKRTGNLVTVCCGHVVVVYRSQKTYRIAAAGLRVHSRALVLSKATTLVAQWQGKAITHK
jgi:hypothetical protein